MANTFVRGGDRDISRDSYSGAYMSSSNANYFRNEANYSIYKANYSRYEANDFRYEANYSGYQPCSKIDDQPVSMGTP